MIYFAQSVKAICRFSTGNAIKQRTALFQAGQKELTSLRTSACPEESEDVLNRLHSKVRSQSIVYDSYQEKAAIKLSRLQKAFLQYNPDGERRQDTEEEHAQNEHHTTKERGDETTDTDRNERKLVPRGLYIHGEVGCGKSFLMDLFFDSMSVKRKRRVHFHSFMNDVHKRIHQLKQSDLKLHGRNFHVDVELQRNPIYRVAKQISNEVKLLCFDEFQVTDVADALILSQLFTVLFQEGTVVVATGNRPPQDLYENGINRSYFLPFVTLLQKHCIVHDMTCTTDYRELVSQGFDSFFFTNSSATARSHESYREKEMFKLLVGGDNAACNYLAGATEFPVAINRSLKILQAAHDLGVCRVHFDDMCKANLGAQDYRAFARAFHTVCIEGIPKLTVKEHDQARRFITFVDELYEARCALVCFADGTPEELYEDNQKKNTSAGYFTDISDVTELTPGERFDIFRSQTSGKTVGELASVIELSFAFRRAASRLKEMSSRGFWERFSRPHGNLSRESLSRLHTS